MKATRIDTLTINIEFSKFMFIDILNKKTNDVFFKEVGCSRMEMLRITMLMIVECRNEIKRLSELN